MDATELLQRDHDELRDLFDAAQDAVRDATLRGELFARIVEAMALHDRIEEELFLPAVRQADPAERLGGDLAEAAIRGHRETDVLMAGMGPLDPGAREFVRKLRKLHKKFEQHAAFEEDRIFPFAWRRLGAQRLLDMGARMESRRETLTAGRHGVALL